MKFQFSKQIKIDHKINAHSKQVFCINNCSISNRSVAIHIKLAQTKTETTQTTNEQKTKKRRNRFTDDNEIKATTTAGTTIYVADFELFLSSLKSYIIVSF